MKHPMDMASGEGESLPVPKEDGGPLSYQNWLAFTRGAAWSHIEEFPLFTDAQITGDKPKGLGPYAVLNTTAERDFAETVVGAVMRVPMHLDLSSPRVDGALDRTEESSYHGGGMNDEIAALLSLSMGVRLRPGKCIRDFYPHETDQRGHPRCPDPHLGPVTRRRGERFVVPSAGGPVCLNERTGLLARYTELTPHNAGVIVKVARSYQEAIWLAEIQPELTWLLLVQATETAANHWMTDTATPMERVRDWGPGGRLLEHLEKQDLTSEQIEGIAGIIGPYVGAVRKFREFLMVFLPQSPPTRPPAHTQVDWSGAGMRKVLKRVYDCRSNAVHNGQPFPSVMCEAPMKVDGGYAERPVCSAAQVYGASWTGDDIPILLHTFEYIVRESLLKWWQSMLPSG